MLRFQAVAGLTVTSDAHRDLDHRQCSIEREEVQ